MTFDEWMEMKRNKRDKYPGGEVPFGTAAEVFARAAWEAAYAQGREDEAERWDPRNDRD